jgi:hypothetical protein
VASIHRRSQSLCAATQWDIKIVYPKMEHYKKISSRSLRWKSNRCLHTRVVVRRPSQRDGQA